MRMQKILPTKRGLVEWNALAIPTRAGRQVPIRWEQFLGRRRYSFVLEWNELGRFYVLAIWQREHEIVRTALQYGHDALERFQHIEEIRGIMLVPFDPALAEMEAGITRDNLGKTVRVFYLAREDAR